MKNKTRFSLKHRIRDYIINTFLPAYAKELLEDLKQENRDLKQENLLLRTYIDGMKAGSNNRIKICNYNNGSDK